MNNSFWPEEPNHSRGGVGGGWGGDTAFFREKFARAPLWQVMANGPGSALRRLHFLYGSGAFEVGRREKVDKHGQG